jgi:hypothetical protein
MCRTSHSAAGEQAGADFAEVALLAFSPNSNFFSLPLALS